VPKRCRQRGAGPSAVSGDRRRTATCVGRGGARWIRYFGARGRRCRSGDLVEQLVDGRPRGLKAYGSSRRTEDWATRGPAEAVPLRHCRPVVPQPAPTSPARAKSVHSSGSPASSTSDVLRRHRRQHREPAVTTRPMPILASREASRLCRTGAGVVLRRCGQHRARTVRARRSRRPRKPGAERTQTCDRRCRGPR
jgi:hypothetical protein